MNDCLKSPPNRLKVNSFKIDYDKTLSSFISFLTDCLYDKQATV